MTYRVRFDRPIIVDDPHDPDSPGNRRAADWLRYWTNPLRLSSQQQIINNLEGQRMDTNAHASTPKVRNVQMHFYQADDSDRPIHLTAVTLTFDHGRRHYQRKGVALCSPGDKFSKAEGQRVALRHALEGFGDSTKAAIFKVWLRHARRGGLLARTEPVETLLDTMFPKPK